MTDIFFYIGGFYNRQHRHSAFMSPQTYEGSYPKQTLAV